MGHLRAFGGLLGFQDPAGSDQIELTRGFAHLKGAISDRVKDMAATLASVGVANVATRPITRRLRVMGVIRNHRQERL